MATSTVPVDEARTVTATFQLLPRLLTVLGAGAGTGTITSQAGLSPAINCAVTGGTPSGACSATYPSGTSVVLTGTSAPSSGPVSWTNCPTPNGNQCTVPTDQAGPSPPPSSCSHVC